MSATLATAATTAAAFQVVQLSTTSGEPGARVTIRVDASHLIGGSDESQLFFIPRSAHDASPEPARCDEIPGAMVVGDLAWHAASVEFQGTTYPGFIGDGSFTVPDVETGIYVLAGILDDPFTGCHVFAPFGVGMDLPDTAAAARGSVGMLVSILGWALLVASARWVRIGDGYRRAASRFARSME